MERRAFLAAVGAATTGLSGCTIDGSAGGGTGTAAATVSFDIPAVDSDQPLPVKYTCDGENVSPKVTIIEVAGRIESLALVLTDPDADGFVHWTVWGIPANLPDLPESVPKDPRVRLSEVTPQQGGEVTIRQGTNDFGEVGYGGPCPPEGERHNYHFTLHGLSSAIDVEAGADPGTVRSAVDDAAIGRTTISTFYERGGGE